MSRRSALSTSESPMLLGAGASLAAAFLERRMAAGDPAVLQRLMMLLTAPLSRIESPGEVLKFHCKSVALFCLLMTASTLACVSTTLRCSTY